MAFAYTQYLWLRNRNYTYKKRRCCFIIICTIYSIISALLASVFLVLYVGYAYNFEDASCTTACGYLNAYINCGYQLCCNDLGTAYSFQYCLNDYGQGTYFVLFIVFYCYAFYEFVFMICMLCHGRALMNPDSIIVINQNPQQIGLINYQNQQIYQPNQMNQPIEVLK